MKNLKRAEERLIRLGGKRAKVHGTWFGAKYSGRAESPSILIGATSVKVVLDEPIIMFGSKEKEIEIFAEDVCGDWMKDYREMSIHETREA